MKNVQALTLASIFTAAFLFAGCPAEGPAGPRVPVQGISLEKNRTPVPDNGITLIEGKSAELTAVLSPPGVYGGIYWQCSSEETAGLNGTTGETVTVTGKQGGTAVIKALARNTLNDVYAEASVRLTVTAVSFFKWNYAEDGWTDIPANTAATVKSTAVRAGGRAIIRDHNRGGVVLDGTGTSGARFIIGSTMNSLTNSPLASDPVFDALGKFDFSGQKVRVSIEYEFLSSFENPDKFLRLQVNNNTTSSNNASAVTNWLVAEQEVPAAVSAGQMRELSGVFDSAESRIARGGVPGATETEQLEAVLSHSFIALTLSSQSGSVLVRSIIIEMEQ
ncbi:MAG: hypothetical protein LBQ14_09535 [Treponema sp.]|jgi:hypothetical protein|nr:hypothetical protein [Treponema sp.]